MPATNMVLILASSVYWASVNMYVVDLGFSYTMITLVYSIPWVFGIFSVPIGKAADLYGDRRLFAVLGGLMSSIALFPLVFFQDILFVLVSSSLNSFFWSFIGPVLYAEAMDRLGEGRGVGLMSSAASLGWTVGSFSSGFLYSSYGLGGSALATFLLLLLALPPLYLGFGGNRGEAGLLESFRDSFRIPRIDRKSGSAIMGLAVFFTLYTGSYELWYATLYRTLGEPRIFSSLLGITGVVSAIVSPFVGRLGERLRRRLLALVSVALFSMINILFAFTAEPLVLSVAFLTPLWPFVNVYSYMFARRVWGGAHSSGIVQALWNLTGLFAPVIGAMADAWGTSTALMVSSLFSLALLMGDIRYENSFYFALRNKNE